MSSLIQFQKVPYICSLTCAVIYGRIGFKYWQELDSMQDKMLTVEEVAQELRVHPETVRQWIRNGELIALDLSKEYRILRSDLDAFIASRRGRTKRRRKTGEKEEL